MDRSQRRRIDQAIKSMRDNGARDVGGSLDICAPCSPDDDIDIHPRPWGSNPKAHSGRPVNSFKPPRCKACSQAFAGNDGRLEKRVLTDDGAAYHPSCFCCSQCGSSLYKSDDEPPSYYEKGGDVFCQGCFRTRHGRQCGFCSAQLLEWTIRGAQAYCREHGRDDGVPICFGCERPSPAATSSTLPDGRTFCERCSSTSVSDATAARALYRRVCRFFAEQLGLRMPAAGVELQLEVCTPRTIDSKVASPPTKGSASHAQSGGRCLLGLTCTEQTEHCATGAVVPSSRRVTSLALITALPEDLALTTLAHEAGQYAARSLPGCDSAEL